MKFLLSIIFFGLFVLTSTAFAKTQKINSCHSALVDESTVTVTETLIAYLDTLIEQNYISDPVVYIRSLVQEIDSNYSLSSFLVKRSEDLIQEENYRNYLFDPGLNRRELKQWLVQKLDQIEKIAEQKNRSKEKTIAMFIEAKFHRVEPGNVERFLGGASYYKIDTPFEMMETAVTQRMWSSVMDYNPSSRFEDGGVLLHDSPVESISWWSAAVYANRLSELSGLKPVYDFSRITSWKGSPDKGDYLPEEEHASNLIIINAPNGDIYKAEGYRLPTKQEFHLVYSRFDNRKSHLESMVNGISLTEYGWFNSNAGGVHHGTKERRPFIIDGNPFYDLYGNVFEWTQTFEKPYESDSDFGILNPQNQFGVVQTRDKAFVGGYSYELSENANDWNAGCFTNNLLGGGNLSFRLVRSLPKEKKP